MLFNQNNIGKPSIDPFEERQLEEERLHKYYRGRITFLEEEKKACQQKMHQTAFGAFLAGGFVGGLLMLIVLIGLYGGR